MPPAAVYRAWRRTPTPVPHSRVRWAAERGFIRTLCPQRIVNIDHLQNARQEGYLAIAQTVGVAAAVGVLVMMPNDRKHQAQRLQRTANLLARYRMLLHDGPLLWCEIAAFFQDFIRHRDLSQVVQVAATPQRDDIFFVHAEEASELGGIAREPLTMAFGVWIAGFHAEPQRTQYGVDGFQFVGEFLQLEQ